MTIDAAFWTDERQRLYALLFPQILDAATEAAQSAGAEMAGIGIDWTLVNQDVRDWASQYCFNLVSGITQTSQDYLQKAMADWIASGQPLDDLIATLEPMFGDVRAEMIAVTEITRAYAEGNVAAWKASQHVDGMRWMTAQDELVCDICGPLANTTDTLDGDFGGVGRPPAHVNCRCYLQPVVQA